MDTNKFLTKLAAYPEALLSDSPGPGMRISRCSLSQLRPYYMGLTEAVPEEFCQVYGVLLTERSPKHMPMHECLGAPFGQRTSAFARSSPSLIPD